VQKGDVRFLLRDRLVGRLSRTGILSSPAAF